MKPFTVIRGGHQETAAPAQGFIAPDYYEQLKAKIQREFIADRDRIIRAKKATQGNLK